MELDALIVQLKQMERRPVIGLALAGGSAYGIAHIGVLRYLEEIGIPIDVVAGTSAGSAAGAVWLSGITSNKMYEIVKSTDWWFLAKPVAFKSGLMSSEGIEKWIVRLIGDIDFAELKRPFAAVATDFSTGELVVLREGSVARAVRISCNLPAIYQPVEHNGRLLVDGGLVQNLPAEVCRSLGAEYIIGVDLHSNLESQRPRTVMLSLIHAGNILQRQNELAQLRLVDVAIQPHLGRLSPMNFRAVDRYVESGYEAAKAAADQLAKMISEILRENGAVKQPNVNST